jgi:hypothetical protein
LVVHLPLAHELDKNDSSLLTETTYIFAAVCQCVSVRLRAEIQ